MAQPLDNFEEHTSEQHEDQLDKHFGNYISGWVFCKLLKVQEETAILLPLNMG